MMEYKNIEHALKHMHAQLWHIVEMNIHDTTSIVALHVIYYENDNFHFCYTNTLHTKIEIARMEKLHMLIDCYNITMQDWLLISPTYPPHSQTPYYQLPLLPERTDEMTDTILITRQSIINDDAFQFMRIEHAFNAFQLPPPNLPFERKEVTIEEILTKYQFILSANEVLAVIEYALNTPLAIIKEQEEQARSRTVKELSGVLTKLVLRYRNRHNIKGVTHDDMVLTPDTKEVFMNVYEDGNVHVDTDVHENVHVYGDVDEYPEDIEDVHGRQYGDNE